MITAVVADDEKLIRKSLSRRLEKEKVNVLLATCGSEAVAHCAESDVDIAVLDINMPGIDGLETAAQIMSLSPKTKIIFLTAYGSSENRQKAQEIGLNVVEWIDKRSTDEVAKATNSVLAVAGWRSQLQVRSLVREWCRQNGIAQSQQDELIDLLGDSDLRVLSRRRVSTEVELTSEDDDAAPKPTSRLSLEDAVDYAQVLLADLRAGLSDISVRHSAFQRLKGFLKSQLPDICLDERIKKQRRMIADALEVGISKVDENQLTIAHLDAISVSLQRMGSKHLSNTDVQDCDVAWRSASIDTLPSFEQIIKDWKHWYGTDDLPGRDTIDDGRQGDP